MSEVKTKTPKEKLTTEDYRQILVALCFLIGIDLALETPNVKVEDETLAIIEKVKKIAFKRKPKLSSLSYSKDTVKENPRVLEKILEIVDLVETK